MSRIKLDDVEVVQQYLQDVGPREQMAAEAADEFTKAFDTGYLTLDSSAEMIKASSTLGIVAPIQVSLLSAKHLIKPGESFNAEQIREELLSQRSDPNKDERYIPQLIIGNEVLNSAISMSPARRSRPVRVLGEVEGGGLDNRPLPALPVIVLDTELKPVMANVQVMGRLQPLLNREKSVFDSILNDTATLPKSSPTGRHAIVASTRMELIDYWRGFSDNSNSRIRGLLRSKTKKGPKRKYHK